MAREARVVRVRELCARLRVSPATVRRDLAELERRGELRRVHGGAVCEEGLLEEPRFEDKASLASAEKRRIAQAALGRVKNGDTLFLDGGSTVLELARMLRGRRELTVVTNSLQAALELAPNGPRLILVGGELRRLSRTFVGPLTGRLLSALHIDRAFMGTLGLTLADGPSTTDPGEAHTKELVMGRAREVYLLADGSKIGKASFVRSGGWDKIDALITDRSAPRSFARALARRGVRVVRA
jgi:DeoR/GlpR family transcriptional regulator of sugar metabolism